MIFLTSGEYGRLGHGDNVTQLRPKQVKSLIGQRVVQVKTFWSMFMKMKNVMFLKS